MRFWRTKDQTERDNSGNPDSGRPYGVCPRCNRDANFEILMSAPFTPGPYSTIERDGTQKNDPSEMVVVLRCTGCRRSVVVIEEVCLENDRDVFAHSGKVVSLGAFHWPPAQTAASPDIPPDLASIYQEAVTSLATRLPRAAAILARSALDAITLDKGAPKTERLQKRIKTLASQGILQSNLVDWSDHILLIGNEAVHEASTKVSMEDATDLVNFTGELLKYLYVLPAEIARKRRSP